ncbi:putative S-acyltransferase [Apostasia shenzhenica]|uniref:S-acyltransferase n=1 Tax=Apostasia shenzhenica TaxID=1088818 RepID=A0A2I0BAT9_9ASPA|nr:putative S-acyltransferase [Apostasia shenzhenica]
MGRDRDVPVAAGGGSSQRAVKRPRYLTLPIILVLVVIGYIYYVTVFGVIERWLGLTTAAGVGNAVGFSVLALMCLSTYAIAVLRDPGSVPPSFIPDIEDPDARVHEVKRKGGDLRYCQKCSHYKPPRAHHCRVCKRCVLKMDHHCTWINNCVGHANYKVFFVFVLYSVIACFHSQAVLLGFAYDIHKGQIPERGYINMLHIICGILLFPLTLALSVLLGWHTYLILQNKTTIEHYEGVRAMWLAKKAGNAYEHPYDLGTYENLTSVLGPNIFCWICPSSYIGSGLYFPTTCDNKLETLTR